jgi:alkyl sulfatase BDS1-like metallo-beta-lactamase superfamily hydrolase
MPLSPRDAAPLYVEMMGGAGKIMEKCRQLHEQGRYREAMELLNKLVYAEPGNQAAKDLLADVFEQLGYQKESPSVRNSFLAAAYELRHGMPQGVPPSASGPDTIRGMSTELWLDYVAIMLDSTKAANVQFTANLVTPDNGERFVVELSNSTLTSIKGAQSRTADLTITLNRSDLESVMARQATFRSLAAAGRAKLEGNVEAFAQMMSLLTPFTPTFELLPGTSTPAAPAAPR